jgi:hypothetical protein
MSSDDERLPIDGLSAAIIKGHLVAVTPEEYWRLRPEYNEISSPWTRLLAHEMSHQLHVRLVGSEKKMGPQWFYEGFAMHVAGQLFAKTVSTAHEAKDAIRAKSRGSYARYVAAFEFFLEHIDLNEMLEHASKRDFENWLIIKVES